MIRVQAWNEFVSPMIYGPLAIWPWLKISPQSALNVICLIITAWQWLMSFPYAPCIPVLIKPIKACQVLSSWESSHAVPFPPQDLVVCVNLSQPQWRGHCLPVTTSDNDVVIIITIITLKSPLSSWRQLKKLEEIFLNPPRHI